MQLLLDTGSSALIVASDMCDSTCIDIAPAPWHVSQGVSAHQTLAFGYGSGSANAAIYTTTVSIQSAHVANIAIGAMLHQVSITEPFRCGVNTPSPDAESAGIIGFGPSRLAPDGMDWVTMFFQQNAVPPVYTLSTCSNDAEAGQVGSGGTMALGYAPPSAFWVPAASPYFGVQLQSVSWSGQAPIAVNQVAIVDTGTNANSFPQPVVDSLVRALQPFGAIINVGGCTMTTRSAQTLNSILPKLTFVLNGVQLIVPAVGAYLVLQGGAGGQQSVCFRLGPPLSQQYSFFGWPFISAFDVSFNTSTSDVGFASRPESACGASVVGNSGGGGGVGGGGVVVLSPPPFKPDPLAIACAVFLVLGVLSAAYALVLYSFGGAGKSKQSLTLSAYIALGASALAWIILLSVFASSPSTVRANVRRTLNPLELAPPLVAALAVAGVGVAGVVVDAFTVGRGWLKNPTRRLVGSAALALTGVCIVIVCTLVGLYFGNVL